MSDFIVECPCCGESFTANKESESLRARVAELERERDAAIKERDEARAELALKSADVSGDACQNARCVNREALRAAQLAEVALLKSELGRYATALAVERRFAGDIKEELDRTSFALWSAANDREKVSEELHHVTAWAVREQEGLERELERLRGARTVATSTTLRDAITDAPNPEK